MNLNLSKQDIDEFMRPALFCTKIFMHPITQILLLGWAYNAIIIPKGLSYEIGFFGFLFYNLVAGWMRKH